MLSVAWESCGAVETIIIFHIDMHLGKTLQEQAAFLVSITQQSFRIYYFEGLRL